MITALYASPLAILMCVLAVNVIKQRRINRGRYGDAGIRSLQIARTAHSNAVDYIPISLVLMALLELNQAHPWLLHAAGLVLLTGRLSHTSAVLNDNMKGRVLGMHLTIWTIVALALLNLWYLPWQDLLGN